MESAVLQAEAEVALKLLMSDTPVGDEIPTLNGECDRGVVLVGGDEKASAREGTLLLSLAAKREAK